MRERISITELANINIETTNKNDLVDVSGLTFDNTVPQGERMARILAAVENPYCFRVGDVGVKLEFSDNAPSLHDTLTVLLLRKKRGF